MAFRFQCSLVHSFILVALDQLANMSFIPASVALFPMEMSNETPTGTFRPVLHVHCECPHYANTSMYKYTAIFHGCKNENFQMKNCDIFLIFSPK